MIRISIGKTFTCKYIREKLSNYDYLELEVEVLVQMESLLLALTEGRM